VSRPTVKRRFFIHQHKDKEESHETWADFCCLRYSIGCDTRWLSATHFYTHALARTHGHGDPYADTYGDAGATDIYTHSNANSNDFRSTDHSCMECS
jgi:hypothetical protein